jgi:indolepyruvate ferredoxin oxidoreductase
LVEQALAQLRPETAATVLKIAQLPDSIRGYEHIKLANVRAYHEKLTELRAEFAKATSPSLAR